MERANNNNTERTADSYISLFSKADQTSFSPYIQLETIDSFRWFCRLCIILLACHKAPCFSLAGGFEFLAVSLALTNTSFFGNQSTSSKLILVIQASARAFHWFQSSSHVIKPWFLACWLKFKDLPSWFSSIALYANIDAYLRRSACQNYMIYTCFMGSFTYYLSFLI